MTHLSTERLLLRPLKMTDAPTIQRLAGDEAIARYTLHIPHPYLNGAAEEFIAHTQENLASGEAYTFAIIRCEDERLLGATGMSIHQHDKAEIGYWMGVPYWGQGYMTEAVMRLIQFGFEDLKLNRIYATYFVENGASRRVMEKAGMYYEGTFRQAYRKNGRYIDAGLCAILRSDYLDER